MPRKNLRVVDMFPPILLIARTTKPFFPSIVAPRSIVAPAAHVNTPSFSMRHWHLQVLLVVLAGALSVIQPFSTDPGWIRGTCALVMGILARRACGCSAK